MAVQHPDIRYINALIENNAALIDEIYQKFSGTIKRYILKNNGNADDAADIMQEGLMAVYRKAIVSDFILSCSFEAFLFSVCKKLWLMQLRKKAIHRVTNIGDMQYDLKEEDIQQASIAANSTGKYNLLETCFELLGPSCKEILSMAWKGKALEEVAAMLNITYAYIRKKKSECTGRLVEMIKSSPEYKNLIW
mgnify:CR=1 FL=1